MIAVMTEMIVVVVAVLVEIVGMLLEVMVVRVMTKSMSTADCLCEPQTNALSELCKD